MKGHIFNLYLSFSEKSMSVKICFFYFHYSFSFTNSFYFLRLFLSVGQRCFSHLSFEKLTESRLIREVKCV